MKEDLVEGNADGEMRDLADPDRLGELLEDRRGDIMAVACLRMIISATVPQPPPRSGESTSSERLGIFEMRSVASSRARS